MKSLYNKNTYIFNLILLFMVSEFGGIIARRLSLNWLLFLIMLGFIYGLHRITESHLVRIGYNRIKTILFLVVYLPLFSMILSIIIFFLAFFKDMDKYSGDISPNDIVMGIDKLKVTDIVMYWEIQSVLFLLLFSLFISMFVQLSLTFKKGNK